jgi:hypothetical protein
MFFQDKAEEKLSINERKLKELAARQEKLDDEVAHFLSELEVTPEQLSTFLANQDNFTEENWKELQHRKKMLDEKLDLELKNIRNPLSVKKALASLNVGQHWLHVR